MEAINNHGGQDGGGSLTPSMDIQLNHGHKDGVMSREKVFLTPPELQSVIEDKGTDKIEDKEKCEFKRGGMCKTHQKQGSKFKISVLKWQQDKSGLFKYVRTQQTKYTCNVKNTDRGVTDNST